MATVLVIGNKNYCSWSLRAWLLLTHFGVAFDELRIGLDGAGWPRGRDARAVARSMAAEMHSGFPALRTELPMSCRARGRRVALTDAARTEIEVVPSDERGATTAT